MPEESTSPDLANPRREDDNLVALVVVYPASTGPALPPRASPRKGGRPMSANGDRVRSIQPVNRLILSSRDRALAELGLES